MALVPGLNIGVGFLVLIIIWAATVLGAISLAAVPKARYEVNYKVLDQRIFLSFCRLVIPVIVLLSLIVTLVLIFYPRQGSDETTQVVNSMVCVRYPQ